VSTVFPLWVLARRFLPGCLDALFNLGDGLPTIGDRFVHGAAVIAQRTWVRIYFENDGVASGCVTSLLGVVARQFLLVGEKRLMKPFLLDFLQQAA